MEIKDRIEYTNRGFSYIKVTPLENLKWGGYCVCNGCNEQILKEDMYLVYVLGDTYCQKCFNEWLERQKEYKQENVDYDLKYQKKQDLKWYSYHLEREEK